MKATQIACSNHTAFNNPESIQLMQLKLPMYLQERWNRNALSIKKRRHTELTLEDFVAFIDEETTVVNNPNYSKDALGELQRKDNFISDKRKVTTMLSLTDCKKSKKCLYCEGNCNDLDQCQSYLKLNLDDRRKILFKNRLCFCCYGMTSKEHSAKTCRNKRRCSVCRKFHPTGLHGYQKQNLNALSEETNDPKQKEVKNTSLVSIFAKVGSHVIGLCVVEVKITHNESNCEILTYALLNNGSQGTFVHNDVIEKLGLEGELTVLSVKTSLEKKNSFVLQ